METVSDTCDASTGLCHSQILIFPVVLMVLVGLCGNKGNAQNDFNTGNGQVTQDGEKEADDPLITTPDAFGFKDGEDFLKKTFDLSSSGKRVFAELDSQLNVTWDRVDVISGDPEGVIDVPTDEPKQVSVNAMRPMGEQQTADRFAIHAEGNLSGGGGGNGDGGTPEYWAAEIVKLELDITAFRPQHEGLGNGDDENYSPFQKRSVDEEDEESPTLGPGIRLNGDEQNEAPSQIGENDLIEMELEIEGETIEQPSLVYLLKRSDDRLKVWFDRDRNKKLSFQNNTSEKLTADMFNSEGVLTCWAEWDGTEHPQNKPELKFQARKNGKSGEIFLNDILVFHTFQSVIIALGGLGQTPSDPSSDGIFQIANEIYRRGYNVHMYDEDRAEDNREASEAFQEVRNAVEHRKVNSVAIYGFSRGGGSTHDLSNWINNNLEVNIVFTGYIDAIAQGLMEGDPETRYPPGSEFLLNIYQEAGPTFGLEGAIVEVPRDDSGEPVGEVQNVNTDNAHYHSNEDHDSIDEDEDVLERMRMNLIERVDR